LATLLHPYAAPCQNLVLYGTEATGKSAITTALLERLEEDVQTEDDDGDSVPALKSAIVKSIECITSRHLYESVVSKVAAALHWEGAASRCESASQLTVELSKMLKYASRPKDFRFVLVFDGIDRQREAPATLIPALARLSEIIPRLTTVFIVTSPPPSFLRTSFVPHVHFPNYTKSEFVTILTRTTPPATLPTTTAEETADLWARFVGAVHDSLARAASRTLPTFKQACTALWPRFTAPILAGTHAAREFSKLLVAARVHFQDESLLDPGIIIAAVAAPPAADSSSAPATTTNSQAPTPVKPTPSKPTSKATPTTTTAAAPTDLASLLPTTARLLLLAAYLASHNATRHDLTLFSTHHHGRRRKRGGLSVSGMGSGRGGGRRSQHRKIARKLLGAHAFVLERMLAIFAAVRGEWDDKNHQHYADTAAAPLDADIGMAIATLASLKLLVRVGGAAGADLMDHGGKWRVNVGWEVVRGLGRSMGVEIEEWLIE